MAWVSRMYFAIMVFLDVDWELTDQKNRQQFLIGEFVSN